MENIVHVEKPMSKKKQKRLAAAAAKKAAAEKAAQEKPSWSTSSDSQAAGESKVR